MEAFQEFGFQVACVIALGAYVAKVQNEQRIDSKAREERLSEELKELSNTNRMLLETNAVIVKEVNRKLDEIMRNK